MRRPHMHMHVTGFSAATIFVFAIASPLHAQGIEAFGEYSVNADHVQNRPAILIVEQKVSPRFLVTAVPSGRSGAGSGSLPSLRRLSESCTPDRIPPRSDLLGPLD